MIHIRLLQIDDCPIVASAHAAYLNTPFKTIGGLCLLQAHYEMMIAQMGCVGYVAIVDRQIAGYVCGIWNRSKLKYIKTGKILTLTLNTFRHIFADPKFLLDIPARIISSYTTREAPVEGYELRPIVVLPEFRGQGVAEKLVERLLDDAKSRGYTQVFLFTENNNLAAIKFYSRFGFVFEAEKQLNPGTTHAITGKLFRYYIKP